VRTSDVQQAKELSFLVGMANISFTEAQSTLSGPNQTVASSGSVAAISGMLHYRFLTSGKRAFYSQFTFPMMGGEGSYLSGGAGMEYYWGENSARNTLHDSTTTLAISPVMRFFALGQLNLAYLAYNTLSAKKSDTLLELELGGGLSRQFSKFTLRAQAGIARGVGVTTTTMGMKLFVGATFFFED
jgi:hypothetical protein